MTEKTYRNALPAGHSLLWYRIERVLGQGAFGITYLAHDVNLDRRVAIKEFLPGQYATRDGDQSVHTLSAELHSEFHQGLERFLKEARTLAKFEHPNVVRVLNVFEANHTAYMVMTYEEGRTLREVLVRTNGTLNEMELRKLLIPLLDGLEHIHAASFIHRDIKPANIFIRTDGSPVLIDFGSARQAVQGQSLTLTNFVSQGYAAIEQYSSRSDKQGPWTDIYGMGATLFRAMTGKSPADAVDRSEAISHGTADVLTRLTSVAAGRYSESFIRAVEHALAFRAQDRPQSIADWCREFEGQPAPAPRSTADEPKTIPINPPAAEPGTVPINAGDEVKTIPQPRPDQGGPQGVVALSEAETVVKPKPAGAKPPIAPVAGDSPGRRLYQRATSHPKTSVAVLFIVVILAYMIFSPRRQEENTAVQTDATTTAAPASGQTAATPAGETAAPASAVPDHPVAAPAGGGTPATPATATPPLSPEQQRAKQINALLAAARADITTLRLTTPKGDNAFDSYLQVLALAPGNAEAQQGITAIAQKYVELTYRDLDGNNLDRAESYLKKAEEIAPQADFVKEARHAFDAKRNPPPVVTAAAKEEPKESLQDKAADFKKRFEDFMKSQQQPPAQKTRADEMRERLGGGH